jgi:DNA-binding PadR family transcriptional regulator
MTRRKVSNPLALAVLACLAEKPMHPYEVASTLRTRHKDASIKLNYGSLYSVFEALCRHHFIRPQKTVRAGKRPERTIFELTEAGSVELRDWLSELLARPIKEYTGFEAGLSLMPVLPPKMATELLDQRCDSLEIEIATADSIGALAKSKNVPRLFIVEREYATMLRRAELKWLRELSAEIASGKIDGFDQWQNWHLAEDDGE